MARLEIVDDGLWVRLSIGEKIMAFHGDVFIPVTSLRGAEVANRDWWKTLGLRLPGTGIPGLVIYGTYVWKRRDFVAWHYGQQVLRLNLSGKTFAHIYIGTDRAVELADEVNDALTRC